MIYDIQGFLPCLVCLSPRIYTLWHTEKLKVFIGLCDCQWSWSQCSEVQLWTCCEPSQFPKRAQYSMCLHATLHAIQVFVSWKNKKNRHCSLGCLLSSSSVCVFQHILVDFLKELLNRFHSFQICDVAIEKINHPHYLWEFTIISNSRKGKVKSYLQISLLQTKNQTLVSLKKLRLRLLRVLPLISISNLTHMCQQPINVYR